MRPPGSMGRSGPSWCSHGPGHWVSGVPGLSHRPPPASGSEFSAMAKVLQGACGFSALKDKLLPHPPPRAGPWSAALEGGPTPREDAPRKQPAQALAMGPGPLGRDFWASGA